MLAAKMQVRQAEGKPMGTAGWIILGVLVLVGLWLIMTYNGLVSLRQRCRQAFSDIDVQLKQRHDLVPNLVETVKGYAAHERGTLEAVIQARNAAVSRAGAGGAGPGRGRAAGRAAPAVRAGRGLSRPQGQPELPAAADRAVRPREQDRRRAPLLQQHGGRIQLHARELPGRAVRPVDGLRPAGVLQPRRRRARGRADRAAGEVLSVIPDLRVSAIRDRRLHPLAPAPAVSSDLRG